MARALYGTAIKALSDSAALVIKRRGYSAAVAAEKAVVMKGKREAAAVESAWVPDPVTGYYRPANRMAEVDAAELRAMLLSNKSSPLVESMH